MAENNLSESERSVGFLKFIARFWFVMFLFTAPLIFVVGLPGIILGGWPVWVGIVVSLTGLAILILIITYSVVKDMKRRKEGGRFINILNLAIIASVGVGEIIVGVPLYFVIETDLAVGFSLFVGGCLTFLPAAIYLLVLVLQDQARKNVEVY